MSSILKEFAYGNISPEVRFFKRNSQYGEAMRALSGNEEKLLARLNEDEKILFQKYVDAQDEVNQLTAVGNLIYGFKLRADDDGGSLCHQRRTDCQRGGLLT